MLEPIDTGASGWQDWEIGDTVTLADGQSFTVCGIMEPLSIDACIQNVQGLGQQITLIALPRTGEFSHTGFYWTERDLGIYQRADAAFGEKILAYNRYALFWTTMDWDNVGKWGMLLMMGVLGLFVLTAFFTLVLNAASIALEERNLAQVTMNLTDYTKSSIYSVFEMVKMEARRYGVRVVGSEVVGIVPMKALLDCAEYYLQIEDFSSEQVLELHIE